MKKQERQPWLVWLSGLSADLRTTGLLVQFPVGAYAWVAGQVPSGERVRGNHTLMFLSLSSPSPPPSLKINKYINKILKTNKQKKPQKARKAEMKLA